VDKFTKRSNATYVNIKSRSYTVCLISHQYRRGVWPVCLLVTAAIVWIVEFGLLTLYPLDLANQAPKDTPLVQEESF
jgi:hypothetical protein